MDILVSEYESTKDINLARKLHSTYQLMKAMAMKADKRRIKYYKGLIDDIYSRVMEHVFSKENAQALKTTL
jgi:hypothetical protein